MLESESIKPGSIAFFSPDVPDMQTLIDGLIPGTDYVILNDDGTELEQIAHALAQSKFASVHIISHGAPGRIFLGKTVLSDENIDDYAPIIAKWKEGLAPGADILIYGCNVAAPYTNDP